MHIKASGDYCVLVSKDEEDQTQYVLTLSNSVGCPIESKVINIEPRFVTMNHTHIIVCSEDTVYYWQY